jgi:hypothetical protein
VHGAHPLTFSGIEFQRGNSGFDSQRPTLCLSNVFLLDAFETGLTPVLASLFLYTVRSSMLWPPADRACRTSESGKVVGLFLVLPSEYNLFFTPVSSPVHTLTRNLDVVYGALPFEFTEQPLRNFNAGNLGSTPSVRNFRKHIFCWVPGVRVLHLYPSLGRGAQRTPAHI